MERAGIAERQASAASVISITTVCGVTAGRADGAMVLLEKPPEFPSG